MASPFEAETTPEVRVRIAPSPTGSLHVGTARTALFNYLFAKGRNGKFILRIEDTDLERSSAEFEQNIYESLLALGLAWDEGPTCTIPGAPAACSSVEDDIEFPDVEPTPNEAGTHHNAGSVGLYGPYKQSQRLPIYQNWARRLQEAGLAYECYLTPEELEAERQAAQAADATAKPAHEIWRCRDPKVREALSKDPNRKPSLRFEVPDTRGQLTFQDHIRGEVSFDTALIGDFVILKSDGMPTYNFAVVIDDWLMRITHIIRGEDHISNTPKQILIYEALQTLQSQEKALVAEQTLGALQAQEQVVSALNLPLLTPDLSDLPDVRIPEFAHVGMILAPDRSKLSKRHGATAVSEFIRQGYLPEAFCNFLALLGWFPPDGEEVAPLAHFAEQFSLERIAQSPAIFDKDKLNFINGKLIRTMNLGTLLTHALPYLHALNLEQFPHEKILLILDAVREKITLLSELSEAMLYFFGQKVILDAKLVGEVLTGPEPAQVLKAFQDNFLANVNFEDRAALSSALKDFTKSQEPIKTKTVMWALRAALTGRTSGADMGLILYVLGKDTACARIETALSLTTGSVA